MWQSRRSRKEPVFPCFMRICRLGTTYLKMEHHCVGCNITIVANFKSNFAKVDGKTRIKLKCVVPAQSLIPGNQTEKLLKRFSSSSKIGDPVGFLGMYSCQVWKWITIWETSQWPALCVRESFHGIPISCLMSTPSAGQVCPNNRSGRWSDSSAHPKIVGCNN